MQARIYGYTKGLLLTDHFLLFLFNLRNGYFIYYLRFSNLLPISIIERIPKKKAKNNIPFSLIKSDSEMPFNIKYIKNIRSKKLEFLIAKKT